MKKKSNKESMGQKICLEERTEDQGMQDKWMSYGNSYRSDYFANMKTGEDYKSIEIERVRNAKIVQINDCEGRPLNTRKRPEGLIILPKGIYRLVGNS